MRKHIVIALSFVLATTAIVYALSWKYNLEDALKDGKRLGKPLMVDFYTDWCGWSVKLDRDTYADKKVQELAAQFICVKVDGDKNPALVKRYNVTGYPSIFFLSSNGKITKKIPGYVTPDKIIPVMNGILKRKNSDAGKGKSGVAFRKKSPFVLSGILYDARTPKAIINGNIVRVGDEVDGATILSIERNSATISYKDRRIALNISE